MNRKKPSTRVLGKSIRKPAKNKTSRPSSSSKPRRARQPSTLIPEQDTLFPIPTQTARKPDKTTRSSSGPKAKRAKPQDTVDLDSGTRDMESGTHSPNRTNSPSAIPSYPQPGRIFANRYRLIKQLGRGGMASVWLAEDQCLNHSVALKFPSLENFYAPASVISRLKTATLLAHDLTHENIIRTYDWIAEPGDDGACAISLEYVDGVTLDIWRKNLRNGYVVFADDLLPLAEQICNALAYAHQKNFVHRDIKLRNIMLRKDGVIKILDSDIAAVIQATLDTTDLHSSGTPGYMSLQQMDSKHPPAPTDDIYSLGVVLYELLAGAHPYKWDNSVELIRQMLQGVRPASINTRRLEGSKDDETVALVPDHWETTIAACLAQDPARRPQTVEEVWRLLQSAPVPKKNVATNRASRRRRPHGIRKTT